METDSVKESSGALSPIGIALDFSRVGYDFITKQPRHLNGRKSSFFRSRRRKSTLQQCSISVLS